MGETRDMAAQDETPRDEVKFDFSAFPPDTLFYDRREGQLRRGDGPHQPSPVVTPEAAREAAPERAARKERRRRVDPTTFEKQYSDDEIEFMNAMQNFKVQSGKTFPSHGDVLRVAMGMGYRQFIYDDEPESPDEAARL